MMDVGEVRKKDVSRESKCGARKRKKWILSVRAA
jgi:hypothetical protein